jgi:plasmid replication initiation protein
MSTSVPLLLPDRHPERDFFIADIFDNLPFKDDLASMEHPIFSLSTRPDLRELIYTHENATISFTPSTKGLPTIFDKDVLLYCGSLMMAQINSGLIPPKTLRVSVHDLLVATNRSTNGQAYSALKESLDRLHGVSIKTNIKTNRREQIQAFHLIDNYSIVESSKVKNRMVRLEITLSDWFYNSVIGKEVLTISREYFRLRKPLERRLYELARKHCGTNQSEWRITLENLQLKSGSVAPIKKFRFFIRNIVKTNHIPDYLIYFNDKLDLVIFTPRELKKTLSLSLKTINTFDSSSITIDTWHRAKKVIADSGYKWDLHNLLEQYLEYIRKRGCPKNINAAFLGFIKKKIISAL